MTSHEKFLTIAIICMTIGFAAGGIRMKMKEVNFKTELVNRGYALYCPNNGQFAFVGECKE